MYRVPNHNLKYKLISLFMVEIKAGLYGFMAAC